VHFRLPDDNNRLTFYYYAPRDGFPRESRRGYTTTLFSLRVSVCVCVHALLMLLLLIENFFLRAKNTRALFVAACVCDKL
jgi:hypothetical protein